MFPLLFNKQFLSTERTASQSRIRLFVFSNLLLLVSSRFSSLFYASIFVARSDILFLNEDLRLPAVFTVCFRISSKILETLVGDKLKIFFTRVCFLSKGKYFGGWSIKAKYWKKKEKSGTGTAGTKNEWFITVCSLLPLRLIFVTAIILPFFGKKGGVYRVSTRCFSYFSNTCYYITGKEGPWFLS